MLEIGRKIMASFGTDRADPRQETREMPRLQPTAPQTVPLAMQTGSHAALAPKVAVLGPTLRFKGELSAEEDFVLQGSVEGSIDNPQCVTVGTDGSMVGDIKARVITVDGKVEGDLHGGESVVVHQTGRVTGNIFAPRVGIVEGAYFSGRIEMVDKTSVERTSTARAAAAAPRTVVPSEIAPGIPLSPEATEKVLSKR
jgi:cytoskeletal protein CcmA (bactofilin family)